MLLDKDTNKIQINLTAPIYTGPIAITVEYEDTINVIVTTKTLFIQASDLGTTDILGAPATSNTARKVIELHFCNTDSVAQQVQVVLVHPGGSQIIQNVPLAAGDTLHYNQFNGWSIQVAGAGGRGPIMKKYRLVAVADSPVTVLITDDIIDVDASGGTVRLIFDPTIVTAPMIAAGFIKEVEVNKVDNTSNMVDLFDGTNSIDTISQPVNAQGGGGGSRNVHSNGINLRSSGVG